MTDLAGFATGASTGLSQPAPGRVLLTTMDTTGQAPDRQQAIDGQAAGEHRVDNGHSAVWLRVAELYPQLAADPRTIRRWIARNVPANAQQRRQGDDGGCAELYLRADYLPPLTASYGPGASQGEHGTIIGQASGEHGTAIGQAPGGPQTAIGQGSGAEVEGWRELVVELRAELNRAHTEVDRLRSELSSERVARQEALRRVEDSEMARTAAERRLEALRASWWQWRTLLDALGLWQRLRRRWPDAPAELVADRLLVDKTGHGT